MLVTYPRAYGSCRLLAGWLLMACSLAGCNQSDSPVESRDGTTSHQSQSLVESKSSLADYQTARRLFWSKLYVGKVASLYCGDEFNSQRRRGYNVEHVFPMSWATNGLNCGNRKQCRQRSKDFNRIEGDLHNLFPARVNVNKERSSYRFGQVNGEKREFGRCDFEVDYRARAVEPTEAVRGDVARAMFYMAYHYKDKGLKLFDKQAKLLLKWHKADAPSKEERRRNNVIETLQGNRNPFIDQPKLLESLYGKGAFKS